MDIDVSKIASVAIYPAIGIARVGNSPEEYFVGPTIPGTHPDDPGDFRDPQGRIKRQAAKFFVYALDANGEVLGELNAENGAEIDWRVDVANKKAGWYNFDLALDIPAARGDFDLNGNSTPGGPAICSRFRNPEFQGADRKKLLIEPRARHITGQNTNADGSKYQFDDGEINGQKVYLGELRTDEAGRLLFLGGRGLSQAFIEGKELTTFANNQGWHDDVSDGPVDAKVKFGGQEFEAKGAWVVTAPPNYAVGVQAFTTGYQLLENVAYMKKRDRAQLQTEFWTDVFPTLKHLSLNEWVNAGVLREFGWGSGNNFENSGIIERLTNGTREGRPVRQSVFECFRDADFGVKKDDPNSIGIIEADSWPPLYGDAVTFNIASPDPRNFYAITQLQYDHIQNWAEGQFTVGLRPVPKDWQDMSPAEQANGLTEAALEETLGGPFHPGCEFTWPMRHAMMFEADDVFRIKRRTTPKENFGPCLNYTTALAEGGPLDGSSPGDITRWMAVPWQTDTSSCLSAYKAYGGEFLPTFWPARVPNDVLTEQDYKVVRDPNLDDNVRVEAFSPSSRKKWLRGFIYKDNGEFLPDRFPGGITRFTHHWDKAGIVVRKTLDSTDEGLFPQEVWVETGRQAVSPSDAAEAGGAVANAKSAAPDTRPQSRFVPSWVSDNPRLHR